MNLRSLHCSAVTNPLDSRLLVLLLQLNALERRLFFIPSFKIYGSVAVSGWRKRVVSGGGGRDRMGWE